MWSFRLTDKNRVPIAEVLNASERKLKSGIKIVDTASFKIRADNELLYNIFAENTLLQVWQDQKLRFWGPVITPEYASSDNDEDTVQVNAASPMWYMAHRIAGKSATGTAFNALDKGNIANQLISYAQVDRETHIEFTGQTSGTLVNYTAGPYKPVLTCIRDLASGFDGFDWRMLPLENGGVNGAKIGQFDIANIIGENQVDTVFEFGCGKHNMRGMTYKRDLSTLVNGAYHLTDAGATDPAGVVFKQSLESVATNDILAETVIESGGLTDLTLREQWAQENINVRSVPRLIATMTSDLDDGTGRTPTPWRDYSPGDFVQMRARKNGVQLFAAAARCYVIEVAVDNNGQATYTPTLVEEEGTGGEEG